MAVLSKFAVSVAVVAVGYEGGHCGTASALQLQTTTAAFQQVLNNGVSSFANGGGFQSGDNFGTETYSSNNDVLKGAIQDYIQDGASPPQYHGAITFESSKQLRLDLETVVDTLKEWKQLAVSGEPPQAVKEAFELLNHVDDKTLLEYCGAVNELGLSTDEVIAFIKDMPETLQGDALANYITRFCISEGQKTGRIMEAVRMLQEKLEGSNKMNVPVDADGIRKHHFSSRKWSEVKAEAAAGKALKGADVAYLCMLLLGLLIVCAGGCCLCTHHFLVRAGLAA